MSMHKSESIANLAAALVAFQAEVRNPHNSAENPFHRNKYAPLQDILRDVRPLLAQHGLSVSQLVHSDGEAIGVTTMLMHTSGEYIADTASMQPGSEKGKSAAQVAGSIITYLRRYALAAVLGIASEDDDDGNVGLKQAAPKKTEANPQNGEWQALVEQIGAALKTIAELEDEAVADGYRSEGREVYHSKDVSRLREFAETVEAHADRLREAAYKDKRGTDADEQQPVTPDSDPVESELDGQGDMF